MGTDNMTLPLDVRRAITHWWIEAGSQRIQIIEPVIWTGLQFVQVIGTRIAIGGGGIDVWDIRRSSESGRRIPNSI